VEKALDAAKAAMPKYQTDRYAIMSNNCGTYLRALTFLQMARGPSGIRNAPHFPSRLLFTSFRVG